MAEKAKTATTTAKPRKTAAKKPAVRRPTLPRSTHLGSRGPCRATRSRRSLTSSGWSAAASMDRMPTTGSGPSSSCAEKRRNSSQGEFSKRVLRPAESLVM